MTIYSYSRINTYFTCPAQFQFRYIERRPSPAAEGIELFLGSRFHETMEHLYQQVPHRVPTVNQLLNYFQAHWEKHWKAALDKQKRENYPAALRIVQEGPTVEDYFQKGQLFVENYYHQYHPFDQDKTEGIELKVLFDLDPQGHYKMQGFIDRLGRDDEGVLWIHDYKTSSRKMSQEDVKNEDQLALYQIGLSQNSKFGPKEKIKLIWHFVAFEKDQVTAERNEKEIGWLKDKYISKIQTIEKAKSFPTKPGVLCQWCEYLSVCGDGKGWVENKKKKQGQAAEKPASPPEILPVPAGDALSKPSPERTPPSFNPGPFPVTEAPTAPDALPPEKPGNPTSAVLSSDSSNTLKQKGKKSRSRVVSVDQLSLF